MQTVDYSEGGEKEHQPAPPTTDDHARLSWPLLQRDRKCKQSHTRPPEGPRVYAVPDGSSLAYPDESFVVFRQLGPGQLLHACPMIEEEMELLSSRSKKDVAVMNLGEEGDIAGAATETGTIDDGLGLLEIPEEEFNSEAAIEVGEHLCQKRLKIGRRHRLRMILRG